MAKYRGTNHYIGAWHYVLLDILYAIPLIGFIALLVHSFSQNNENRRHYARSYFAKFLLAIIIFIILFVVLYLTVGETELNRILNDFPRAWEEFVQGLNKSQRPIIINPVYSPGTP